MLFVFVQQVVEDFLVEESDALEIVSRSGLKAYNLIDQSVGLVAQICDILLSLDFLLYVCRIVTDL